MIVTPAGFVPDHRVVDDENAIVHLFSRDRLVQRTDAPELLSWTAYRELGLVAGRKRVIGRPGGYFHVAVASAATGARMTRGTRRSIAHRAAATR